MINGGIKHDQGKLPWHLVPWDAMVGVVKVLLHGVRKYAREIDVSAEDGAKWFTDYAVQGIGAPVIKAALTMQTTSADPVTKKTFENGTPTSQNDSAQTLENGLLRTPIESEKHRANERSTPHAGNVTGRPDGKSISGSTEPHPERSQSFACFSEAPAQYARGLSRALGRRMLITITLRDNLEESFVVDATTDWECFARALTCLRERFPTWKYLLRINFEPGKNGVLIKENGARNWELGMDWSRLHRAALNHVISWGLRDEIDEESGLSHLFHAICCLLFLAAYELRGIGNDDRPALLNPKPEQRPDDQEPRQEAQEDDGRRAAPVVLPAQALIPDPVLDDWGEPAEESEASEARRKQRLDDEARARIVREAARQVSARPQYLYGNDIGNWGQDSEAPEVPRKQRLDDETRARIARDVRQARSYPYPDRQAEPVRVLDKPALDRLRLSSHRSYFYGINGTKTAPSGEGAADAKV